tara:strand:- start:5151 stop:5279 length:129 start_codon:yes stop_codon:yes gene_type:complete
MSLIEKLGNDWQLYNSSINTVILLYILYEVQQLARYLVVVLG